MMMNKVLLRWSMLAAFFLITTFITGCHSQQFNKCPDFFYVLPCSCMYLGSENVALLDCSNVKDGQQLSDIFHNTENYPSLEFKEFKMLYTPTVKEFNADFFGSCNFIEFIAVGGALERVETGAFVNSVKGMTKLDLRRNAINAVENFPFSDITSFKKLTHLYLSENNFPSWPASFGSASITYLDMSQNPITELSTDAFSLLPKLEQLYLRDCQLTNIEAGTFAGLDNLNHLELSHNQLSVLSANFFPTGLLQSLAIYIDFNNINTVEPESANGGLINVYGNQVSVLEEAVWKPHLEAGGALSIGDNPLSCFCPLAWLIRNPDLMNNHVDYLATCQDGRMLYDLTEDDFSDCP